MPTAASSLPFYATFLWTELAKRKNRNPRFSLRAFAKTLDLEPATLSRILNGKQRLSVNCCRRILAQLELNENDKRLFLISFADEQIATTFRFVQRTLENGSPSDEEASETAGNDHLADLLKRTRLNELQDLVVSCMKCTRHLRPIDETIATFSSILTESFSDVCFIHTNSDTPSLLLRHAAVRDSRKTKIWQLELEAAVLSTAGSTFGPNGVARSKSAQLLHYEDTAMLRAVGVEQDQAHCLRAFGITSTLCTPLTFKNSVIGTLMMSRLKPSQNFTTTDLVFAEEISSELAFALHILSSIATSFHQ